MLRTSCELASHRRFVVITCYKNYHCLSSSFHHMLLLRELAFSGSHCSFRTYYSVRWTFAPFSVCFQVGNLQRGREACGEVSKGRKDLVQKVVFMGNSKATIAGEALILLNDRKESSPQLLPLPGSFLSLLQLALCSPLYIILGYCNL